jgi:nicotinamidase-related amidase
MHRVHIPQSVIDVVRERTGKVHPFDSLDPKRTALVVVDMQNYFLRGITAKIVPAVNRLADELRKRGGKVVWLRHTTEGTHKSWSVKYEFLKSPEGREEHLTELGKGGKGLDYLPELDIRPGDGKLKKKRFSAFIRGSSSLEKYLLDREIDTILVVGTATNVCCESTARDAMMLNFKVVMISDAMSARSDEIHNASLAGFYLNFGDVQTVDEVLASLDRGAKRTPNLEGRRTGSPSGAP